MSGGRPTPEMDDPSTPPECLSCEDTGYEPGTDLYCTFCKKGCAVAAAAIKAGKSPWGDEDDDPCDYDERDPMLESFGDFHE